MALICSRHVGVDLFLLPTMLRAYSIFGRVGDGTLHSELVYTMIFFWAS